MYPRALDAGVPVSGFWELSIAEVNGLLASFRRRTEAARKESVLRCFNLAQMIENIVPRVLDQKAARMYPWDLYPEMFAEEQKCFEAAKAQEDFEALKERRREAMDRYNSTRKAVQI